MKGKRRLWCAALALCFILGLFPVRARAATIVASGPCGAENESDLIWTLDDTGLLTFRGSGAMQDYSTQKYTNNNYNYYDSNGTSYYPHYTTAPWYSYRDQIKSVVIPDGVTRIGDYAFYSNDPFYNTNYTSYVKCRFDQLATVTLADSVESIGQYAFYNCVALESFQTSQQLQSVGDFAFAYCTALAAMTIPESVSEIGDNAFLSCKNLTVTAPPDSYAWLYMIQCNVKHIIAGTDTIYVHGGSCGAETPTDLLWRLDSDGEITFIGGGAMQDYSTQKYTNNNYNYYDSNGTSYYPHYTTAPWYSYRDQIKSVVIPDGVTRIGDYAFYSNDPFYNTNYTSYVKCRFDQLATVTLADSVESVGQYAFYNCVALAGFHGSYKLTTIGQYALAYCTAMTDVTLQEGLDTVGEGTFASCSELESLIIPKSVSEIGVDAFSKCTNLVATVSNNSYAHRYCLLNSVPHNAIDYPDADAAGVEVTPESATIEVGQTTQLTAEVKPVNAQNTNVTWTSLTPSVATVDETGLVTGLSAGEARIMATTEDGGFSDFCKVIVTPAIPVSGVTLDKSLLVLDVGGAETLTATIAPENASNKAVTWSSSAPSIVEVDENGVVTMKAAGSAVVTVTTEDGAFTASCTVSTPVSPTEIKLDLSSLTIYPGDTATLNASLLPENATSRTVRWTSSDPDIASVDQNGTVSAVKPGTSIVVATCADGGAFAVCMVTVEASGSVKFVKEDKELDALPENTDKVSASFQMDAFGTEGGNADVNVFLAVYDRDGLMVDLKVYETVLSNAGTVFMQDIDIPEGVQVGRIKIMILSNDMVPLMASSALG